MIKELYSKHRPLCIALALFLAAFIPRILLLSKGPFHYDTVDLLLQMRDKQLLGHGMYLLLPSAIVILAGHLKALFHAGFSDFNFLLVFTAFVAASASPAVYLLFRRIFEEASAVLYAIFISFIPIFFSVSTYGRLDHALSYLLLPFLVYYWFRNRWVPVGIFSGLSICCRPETTMLVPAIVLYIIVRQFLRKEVTLRRKAGQAAVDSASVMLCAFGVCFLMSILFGRWHLIRDVVVRLFTKELDADKIDKVVAFRKMFFLKDLRNLLAGTKMILLFLPLLFVLIGIIRVFLAKRWKEGFLFFSAFAVPGLLVICTGGTNLRHLIVFVFFLIFFLSRGICLTFRRPWLITLASAVILAVMARTAFSMASALHKDAYQVDFARYIERITEPGSLVVIQDEWVFLEYYTERKALVPPISRDPGEWQTFVTKLVGHLASGKKAYLAVSGLAYDPDSRLRKFFENHFFVSLVGKQYNENWRNFYLGRDIYEEQVFLLVPKVMAPNKGGR